MSIWCGFPQVSRTGSSLATRAPTGPNKLFLCFLPRDPVRWLTGASSDINLGSFNTHILRLGPEHQRGMPVLTILAILLTEPQATTRICSEARKCAGVVTNLLSISRSSSNSMNVFSHYLIGFVACTFSNKRSIWLDALCQPPLSHTCQLPQLGMYNTL